MRDEPEKVDAFSRSRRHAPSSSKGDDAKGKLSDMLVARVSYVLDNLFCYGFLSTHNYLLILNR